MTMGIPNAFTQTEVPQCDKRIIMNIRVALVHMILEIDSEKHKVFVIGKGYSKVLFVHTKGMILRVNDECLMLQ